MGKRSPPKRFDHPWLVVHDTCGSVLESSHHLTGAREAFLAMLDALREDGWIVEGESPPTYNVAFCHRHGVGIQVGLTVYDPTGPGPPNNKLGSAVSLPKVKLRGDILIRCKRCGRSNVMAREKWDKLGGEKAIKRLRCSQCDWSCADTTPLKEQRPQERVVPVKRHRRGQ